MLKSLLLLPLLGSLALANGHQPASNPNPKHQYSCFDECVKANGGATFKRDCNFCSCTQSGSVICTLMACPPPPPPPAYPAKYSCYDECVKANGGPVFKRDCNTCRCGSNGSVGCTKMLCARPAH